MKKCGKILVLCLLLFLLGAGELTTVAKGMEGAKITMSPDGNAFTTNAGENDTKWYVDGYEVQTGVNGTLRMPRAGEHLYNIERRDTIPIKNWRVMLSRSICQHDIYPEGNMFHGVSFMRNKCFNPYYSGWFGYCADCNEMAVYGLFYMSEEVAKDLKYLDMSKSYYYKCPHCDNLEQGMALNVHVCKAVSANRYFVRYHANFGSGYMEKSSHMVNNSTQYEGKEVTPQTTLNLNTFSRVGYEFVGWNTEKDGSGISYSDGATIYNLTMEENASIILYAQWEKSKSVLEIDPNGGSYEGKKEVLKIPGSYMTEYRVDEQSINEPSGYTVRFDTSGGEPIADMVGTQAFTGWSCEEPFEGKFKDGIYQYLGKDGTVDRMTAMYILEPIILPICIREGYSFGGWFSDKDCTIPVGEAGDSLTPQKDMMLYADWVDLKLTSKDNYSANQGMGAVNLSWSQKDNQSKVYEVYQRTEDSDWKKISSVDEKAESFEVSKTINFSGEDGYYTVPYSGFYTLTLTGAQGENYGEYSGGKGGQAEATIYLEKGEKLTYTIGGQNGYSGGGKASTFGGGGGFSKVSSERLGTIMIAGGGGGASSVGNGGVGGSSEHVRESSDGQDGETGGGGGYYGGVSGEVNIHQHDEDCCHFHIGNSTVYGGCYTIPQTCGSKDIEYKITDTTFYYGNVADDGSHRFCVRCGSDYCPGHLDKKGVYVCNTCGNQEKNSVSECVAMTGYGVSCEREENYICGFDEGEMISAKPAYGGSNYINASVCITYGEEAGVQSGNGTLRIESKQLGLLDARELLGVIATDLARPGVIDEKSIVKTAVDEDEIRVMFKKPTDIGTNYYHQVKSFDKKTMEFMCESNVTQNTLISQVVGYRYLLNTSEDTQVNSNHAFWAEKGENPFLVIEVSDSLQYLHIAAEDKAGNIGPTIHVKISNDEVVYWPLKTEKLSIEEGENVSPSDVPDTYYVKADSSTPITLTLEGLLCGTARKEYQINEAAFWANNISDNLEEGVFSVIVPNREKVFSGTFTYPTEKLYKKQSGNMGIQDASYTVAKRFNLCKSLVIEQKFTVPDSYDGKMIRVTPRVAATGEKETVYSNVESDLQNSIFIIADGIGPMIKGADALEDIEVMDYSNNTVVRLALSAEDTGSGLAQFYVEVRNQDNGMVSRWEDSELTGKIELLIQEEEPIFSGQFSVLVYAKDKVGNVSSEQSEVLGVGLEAYVKKALEPQTTVFKKGESGKLYINAWGYVERLEISFPLSFVEQDKTLNRVIVYDIPQYMQNEEIPFMVPLTCPEGEMTIMVRAFKRGTQLESEPELITIKVEGSVLDEIRTRLR